MIKLINNWILTLIETVLLVTFAVLMLALDDILNILFGVALIVYTLVFVLSKVVSYRGMIQFITVIEFFAMTTLAIFIIADVNILPDNNIVNTSIGVAMWFRATTEILHSYIGQGEGRAAKRNFNAWKIFLYILLVTAGTFVATTNFVHDDILKYFIIGVAVAAAIIMGVLTYTNFTDYRISHPKPVRASASVASPGNALEDSSPEQLSGGTPVPQLAPSEQPVLAAPQVIEIPCVPAPQAQPIEVVVEAQAVEVVPNPPKKPRKGKKK